MTANKPEYSPAYAEQVELRNMAIESRVSCPTCGAGVTKVCRTHSNNPSVTCHAARVRMWREFLAEQFTVFPVKTAGDFANSILEWMDSRPLTSFNQLFIELRRILIKEARDEGVSKHSDGEKISDQNHPGLRRDD